MTVATEPLPLNATRDLSVNIFAGGLRRAIAVPMLIAFKFLLFSQY